MTTTLVWSGRVDWEDYFREALPLLALPAAHVQPRELSARTSRGRTKLGRKELRAWEAHLRSRAARTADTRGSGCNPAMCVELALLAPVVEEQERPTNKSGRQAPPPARLPLPQAALVADRWR